MGVGLVVVDIQSDFCTGGSLAVSGSEGVVERVNELVATNREMFDVVVASKDWHPVEHTSFATNHPGTKVFDTIQLENGKDQIMWPVHCVQLSSGAELHPQLKVRHDPELIEVHKGCAKDKEAYSAFDDTNLAEILRSHDVSEVYVVGLATDYCVLHTAMDAVRNGFKTTLIRDCCAAVAETTELEALRRMQDAGVTIISTFAKI
uniref:nicotinamidase n=1 Tax=Erythrolobus madagascarensis TaxID=708628 RepID=A0A7S0TBE9_9RHOD|mmetsp:Transcript_928/g.1788  ORF Transcript_928/g.1788 Transcript_928/m.1788 type:complete len:205 (+) Transcript_928:910-1524(+)